MRSDDLAPLLGPGEPSDIGFRQGTMLSWDPFGGSNQVSVGGTVLSNLPLLASNSALVLSAGDVVGLLRVRSQYFILGRIAPAGDGRAYLAGAVTGWGDATWNQWPFTTSTNNDDELLRGNVQKHTPSFWFGVGTYVAPNTSGVFRVLVNGAEVANSGTYTGGGSGAIGAFATTVAWPSSVPLYADTFVSVTGKVTAGTGKVAATFRGLYMV